MTREIAFIEMHDAVLDEIVFSVGGKGRINFEHVAVFVPSTSGNFDVWSARAAFALNGIRLVEIRGTLDEEGCVYKGALFDHEGVSITKLTPSSVVRSRRFDLRFDGSGTEVHILMEAAEFVVDSYLELIETWKGPIFRES